MFFRRASRKAPRRSVPAGTRVYAIGDVHGRYDLLRMLLAELERDDAARASAETELIFLGDLVDRGPASAEVVEVARKLCATGGARLIQGNHEEVFAAAARGDAKAARLLVKIGGAATLLSYGIAEEEVNHGTWSDLAALLVDRIPRDHVDFLEGGEAMIVRGDYLFVHAGIRPGRPLGEQSLEDLRWIREPFLTDRRDHGVTVVHGHTPVEEVQVRPNRIGIDTGAYHSGTLTAIGLEGDESWFVQASVPKTDVA